jgi:hypothetical protein
MEVLLHAGTHVGWLDGERDPRGRAHHLRALGEALSPDPAALRSAQAQGPCPA